jgi:hypothetical protein
MIARVIECTQQSLQSFLPTNGGVVVGGFTGAQSEHLQSFLQVMPSK